MNEAEWLACADPQEMLEFMKGKASDRKLRLFAVACCWRIWPLLAEESRSRSTAARPLLLEHERRIIQIAGPNLEVAERYADGLVGWSEMVGAYTTILGLLNMQRPRQETWAFALVAVLRAVSPGACFYGQEWEYNHYDLYQSAVDAAEYVEKVTLWAGKTTDRLPATQSASVLRDIFGNPFRPVTLDPAWLTPQVVNLARDIYDNRAFGSLSILSDALEDAGCDNDILAHCRGPGPHVRGCWVVDLLLGKE